MKQENGFEDYVEYLKGTPSRLVCKFRSDTHVLIEELDRNDRVVWSQVCPNCGACKESVEHVHFECTSYDSQRLDLLDCTKKVFPPDAFEAFLCDSIFDKTAFCL